MSQYVDTSEQVFLGISSEGKIKQKLLSKRFSPWLSLSIGRYFDEISQDTGKYCFGVEDTLKALEMGAVEILIVYENLDTMRYILRVHGAESNGAENGTQTTNIYQHWETMTKAITIMFNAIIFMSLLLIFRWEDFVLNARAGERQVSFHRQRGERDKKKERSLWFKTSCHVFLTLIVFLDGAGTWADRKHATTGVVCKQLQEIWSHAGDSHRQEPGRVPVRQGLWRHWG